jgi:hypothetical protein
MLPTVKQSILMPVYNKRASLISAIGDGTEAVWILLREWLAAHRA